MSPAPVFLKMLMAGNGDAITISFKGDGDCWRNVLIDGGNGKDCYLTHLRKVAVNIVEQGQQIDLLVITHIDQDHIKGIIYLTREMAAGKSELKDDLVAKYWFNSALSEKIFQNDPKLFDISAAEMREFEEFLHNRSDERWDIKDPVFNPSFRELHGACLTILSPNSEILQAFIETYRDQDIATLSNDYDRSLKELYAMEIKKFEDGNEDLDDKLENAMSIAFLFEHHSTSILYLGDAIPMVIDPAIKELLAARGLDKLTVGAVKLSHHASRKSISFGFLSLVATNKYLVSANGKKAALPNKATFAKILMNEHRDISQHIEFYFNHPDFSAIFKFTEAEYKDLNFSCHDANFEHGYCLPL